MTRRLALIGLGTVVLAGCEPPALPWVDDGPALRTWLEDQTDAGGLLVAQLEVDADAEWQVTEPEVEGLSFERRGEPRVEQVGERVVLTWRWSYGGSEGMYRIPALEASWEGPESAGRVASEPLWVDLGVEPPRDEELADIAEPDRVWTMPWGVASVAAGLGLLVAGGLWLAFRGTAPAEAEERELPPHVRALRAWEDARSDPGLSDHDRALAISRIFRRYAEEVLGFAATAWTTTEILEHLREMEHLPPGNVPRAKRLLRATDRVKFADAEARAELFDELDADLRAFIDSTRPRAWETEEQGGQA